MAFQDYGIANPWLKMQQQRAMLAQNAVPQPSQDAITAANMAAPVTDPNAVPPPEPMPQAQSPSSEDPYFHQAISTLADMMKGDPKYQQMMDAYNAKAGATIDQQRAAADQSQQGL